VQNQKNRNVFYFFFFVTIFITLSGCSVFHGNDLSSIHFSSYPEIANFVNRNTEKLKTMRASALVSVESPHYSDHLSAVVKMKMPDLLWIKVEAALGLDVVTILKNGEEVDFFFNRDNVLFRVKEENLTVEKLLEIFENTDNKDIEYQKYLSSTEVMEVFSGVMMLEAEKSDSVAVFERVNDQYTFLIKKENVAERYEISLEDRSVISKTTVDAEGTVIFESDYSRFRKQSGVYLPKLIRFSMPHLKRRLTILYRMRAVNGEIDESEFVLPLSDDYEEYWF